MIKYKKIVIAVAATALVVAGVSWLYVANPWGAAVDETEQPVWLLSTYNRAADDYLAGLTREALLREFIVAAEEGFGGVLLIEGGASKPSTASVPPLRMLRAVALDSASGGSWDRPRPHSAYLVSALASGDETAISLEAAEHLDKVVATGAPIVFESPLSWSTDLNGDLLDLDRARLRRIIRWIDPRRRRRDPLARAAHEGGSLAESFAVTAAAGGVLVARPDTAAALGTVQLLDLLPRELSDSVFQVARSVESWPYAEALLAVNPSSTLDSLRAINALTEEVLRVKLRPMIRFRLATALMGTQHLPEPRTSSTSTVSSTGQEADRAVVRGQVQLSPKLAQGLPAEMVVDTPRFRALVRRRSIALLNPGDGLVPWSTSRDTIVVLNYSPLEADSTDRSIADVIGVYNPFRRVAIQEALRQPAVFGDSVRVLLILGPTSNLDTVRLLSARLAAHRGVVVSLAVGAPEVLAVLPQGAPLFYLPVADDSDWRNLLAAPFAGVEVSGRLVKGVGTNPVGTHHTLAKTRFAPLDPLTAGIDVISLTDIDAIVNTAIAVDATPGAQVSVIYKGQLVYDRGFGVLAPGERDVVPTDLYDLASLTKVTSTTLAVMKLYEEGRVELNDPIRKYVKGLATATGNLRVRDLLRHETGLRRDIPIQAQVRRNSKSFYSADCRTKYCSRKTGRFTVPVAGRMYFSRNDQAGVYAEAKRSIPNKRKRYGDLNFFLLQQVIESVAGVPLDQYVDSVFYRPMGLEMGYRPLARYGDSVSRRIAPTEYDHQWRRQRLRGYVHDEAAALQGGVAGHAGNFGSAREVAILFDMLARGGTYGERRYLEVETIATFVASDPGGTRALGFAKAPRPDKAKQGVLPVFGHTGFTGTSVWVDPERELTIAFTSNRIYRGRSNWKLQKTKVREGVQRVVYQALPE